MTEDDQVCREIGSQSRAELAELAPDEFYFDGPFIVFTAAYHLRRGFCCNSDCRHCPYR